MSCSTAKRLLIRCDDFGASPGVNAAILQCVDHGLCGNVSVMANGPAAGVLDLGPLAQREVCVGLHVTLNAEWADLPWTPCLAAAAVPTLVTPSGAFTSAPAVLHDRGFSVGEVLAEVWAQLTALRAAGVAPYYLDEHMGCGWIQSGSLSLRSALTRFAEAERLLAAEGCGLRSLVAPDPAAPVAAGWLAALDAAPGGDYLLVAHPARVDAVTRTWRLDGMAPGEIAARRDEERAALCSAEFAAGLVQRGIRLLRYSDLTPPARTQPASNSAQAT